MLTEMIVALREASENGAALATFVPPIGVAVGIAVLGWFTPARPRG
jgi:hypothetical protein